GCFAAFFLIAQPPLLEEEGKSLSSTDSKPHLLTSTSCRTLMGRRFSACRCDLIWTPQPRGGGESSRTPCWAINLTPAYERSAACIAGYSPQYVRCPSA